MLSRTYTSTPLPLDIPNNIFEEGPEAVAAAVAKLDAEGWSTDNKIHSSTMLRARAALAYIRDAILEVALGHNQNPSLENLLYVRPTNDTLFPPSALARACPSSRRLGSVLNLPFPPADTSVTSSSRPSPSSRPCWPTIRATSIVSSRSTMRSSRTSSGPWRRRR